MLVDLLAPVERLEHHRAGPDGEVEGDEIALAPPGLRRPLRPPQASISLWFVLKPMRRFESLFAEQDPVDSADVERHPRRLFDGNGLPELAPARFRHFRKIDGSAPVTLAGRTGPAARRPAARGGGYRCAARSTATGAPGSTSAGGSLSNGVEASPRSAARTSGPLR